MRNFLETAASVIFRNISHSVYAFVFIFVSIVYALEKNHVIPNIIQGNAVTLILIFIGSFIGQTISNEYINHKRDKKINDVSQRISRIEQLDFEKHLDSTIEYNLKNTGLEIIASDVATRLKKLAQDKSYEVTSIYATHSLIYSLMSDTHDGDEFYGFTTILDEWGKDLSYYHDLARKRSDDGVKITRYFMIPDGLAEDQLKKWSAVMGQHRAELANSDIFFLLEKEISGSDFMRYRDDQGVEQSLLKFVEFGLFSYSEKSPVLVYRRGVREEDLETKATCDPEKLRERNIFKKIPKRFRYPYHNEEDFLRVYRNN